MHRDYLGKPDSRGICQRDADENVGESPTQEPAAPGTTAKPGHPAGVATLDVHPVKVNIGIAVPTCVELRLPPTIIDVFPGVDSKPSQPAVAGKRDNQRSAANLRHLQIVDESGE